jgi:hypothetical protein
MDATLTAICWRIQPASRVGAARFAPQLASILTRRVRCDSGTTTGNTIDKIISSQCFCRAGSSPPLQLATFCKKSNAHLEDASLLADHDFFPAGLSPPYSASLPTWVSRSERRPIPGEADC